LLADLPLHTETESDQLDLFTTPTANAATALDTALDAIREKFGPRALKRAGDLDDNT